MVLAFETPRALWQQRAGTQIESLVALSILFVAVELTRSCRGNETLTTMYPWLIALSFGLLHGFAFGGGVIIR